MNFLANIRRLHALGQEGGLYRRTHPSQEPAGIRPPDAARRSADSSRLQRLCRLNQSGGVFPQGCPFIGRTLPARQQFKPRILDRFRARPFSSGWIATRSAFPLKTRHIAATQVRHEYGNHHRLLGLRLAFGGLPHTGRLLQHHEHDSMGNRGGLCGRLRILVPEGDGHRPLTIALARRSK